MSKYMFLFIVITVISLIALAIYAIKFNVSAPSAPPVNKLEIKQEWVLYDVPMSDDLQFFTQDACKAYGVDFDLVLAIIKVESNFRTTAYNSDTDCCGLMQINTINLPMLREECGVTDLFSGFENVIGGIYLLRQALNYDGDTEHALMIYNCGITGAKKLFYKGIHSTEYSRKVLAVRDNLTVRERIYEEVTD